jgi:hypothetical protein
MDQHHLTRPSPIRSGGRRLQTSEGDSTGGDIPTEWGTLVDAITPGQGGKEDSEEDEEEADKRGSQGRMGEDGSGGRERSDEARREEGLMLCEEEMLRSDGGYVWRCSVEWAKDTLVWGL